MQEVADLIDDSDIEAKPETEIDESDPVVDEDPSFPLPYIILMHSLKKLPPLRPLSLVHNAPQGAALRCVALHCVVTNYCERITASRKRRNATQG